MFSSRSQTSIYLSGVKTIRHQSFIILFPAYIHKHFMIIVNISHQSHENEKGCRELIVSTTTYKKNNFTHFFVQQHRENSHKSFQKFITTGTHHFINQHSYLTFSNKSSKLPFGCYFFIIWLNESLPMMMSWKLH